MSYYHYRNKEVISQGPLALAEVPEVKLTSAAYKINYYDKESCLVGWKIDDQLSAEVEFLLGGFVIYQSGQPVGQVALYCNPYHCLDNVRTLTIGRFECVKDYAVFKALMQAVKRFAIDHMFLHIIGPINGTTWESYRFRMPSESPTFLLEPESPCHYPRYFELYGFEMLRTYHSFISAYVEPMGAKYKTRHDYFVQIGVTFERINKNDLSSELSQIANLCNSTFKENYLYSPIGKETFVHKYNEILHFLNQDLIILAKQGEKVVGFVMAYESSGPDQEKILVIKTLAKTNDYKYRGLGSLLTSMVLERGNQLGFKLCIHALIEEGNVSKNISNNFMGVPMTEYRLYRYIV